MTKIIQRGGNPRNAPLIKYVTARAAVVPPSDSDRNACEFLPTETHQHNVCECVGVKPAVLILHTWGAGGVRGTIVIIVLTMTVRTINHIVSCVAVELCF